MGKKRSWFCFVKRLFIPETKSKVEKKTKTWGWFFRAPKFKQCPEIAAPQKKTLIEATEEQRKHVLAVAIATAAAADAAVAAANAAAEVVKLMNFPQDFDRRRRNLAAIQIQSAYRRHLARKALSALKGLVKFQAFIRGEIARRKLHYRHNNWDFSLVSSEEMEALWFRKQEAIIKREHMNKNSYSHRENRNDQALQGSIEECGRQSFQFNQLNQLEALEKGEKERPKFFVHSNILAGDTNRMRQLKFSNAGKQESIEAVSSPFSLPRRSFCHVKQKSIGDDSSFPNSPAFPAYMAATESARAKVRSISTPKQRLILSDTYSGQHSPFKSRLASWSSLNGEMDSTTIKNGISQPIYTNCGEHGWGRSFPDP